MKTYHTGRALAILCGIAAAGGALAILLADPVTTGTWRLDHVLLPVVVAITIASGHLFGSAVREWRFLPAMGFATIFAVGTALTVYSSVGAQKTGAGARQEAEIAHHNGAIEAKREAIEHARARFRQAEAQADREMSGERCGPRCKDWRLRAKEVAAHIAKLEGELQALGALQVTPSKSRPFSEAMGVLGFDAVKVEKIAATFEPFAFSLLFELTAIVAFGFGFGHSRETRQEVPAQAATPDPDTEETPAPTPPKGTGRRGRKVDPKLISFAAEYRARHGGNGPTGSAIMQAFPGMPKSTAYDYAQRVA